MSRKILIFSEAVWIEHTARPLAVARALRDSGLDVHFGAAGAFSQLPADEGFPVHAVCTMDPDFALRRIRGTRGGYDRRLIEAYVDDERTLISRLRPDLILNDFRLPVAISAPLEGVPFVNILNACWTSLYAPSLRPPRDFILTRLLGRRIATAIFPNVMKTALALYARPFNAVAKKYSLPPFENIFDVMASPHLNLICDLDAFAPLAAPPSHFKFIGPILFEPDVPAPHWLSSLDPARPTVYFSMGSSGLRKYYSALKHAFAGTSYQVLITTGGLDPGALPPNFFAAEFAPGLSLVEKSSLVICPGGNGAIYQTLSKGVPVLGIPAFHHQDFNMQRVEDLHLGAALYSRDLFGPLLRETADRIIRDAAVRSACEDFARKIDASDAPASALAAINDLLSSR